MAKTRGLRDHSSVIGGHEGKQRPFEASVFDASMRVVGRVHSTSALTVEGSVVGPISADDLLIVSKSGRVEGDVAAREVVLHGEVRGSVDAGEKLEIQASAVVQGDLHAPRLTVGEGAVLHGDVSTGKSGAERQQGAA